MFRIDFLSLLLLFPCMPMVAYGESTGVERTRIATVGDKHIYLDEIWDSASSNFSDGKPSHNEFATLERYIEMEIIRQEIINYGIRASEAAIQEEARALATFTWESLGRSERDRNEKMRVMREKIKKIHEGLLLWKRNHDAGDKFAKEILRPLGIAESVWQNYTSKVDEPEFLQWVEKARSYDKSHIMREWDAPGRRVAERKALRSMVVGNVVVSDAEVERLFELTSRTEVLEILTAIDRAEAIQKLREQLKPSPHPLPESTYPVERFSGRRLRIGAANPRSRLLFYLAIYCDSLKPGSVTNSFDMHTTGRGYIPAMVYIVKRKIKKNPDKLDHVRRVKLRTEIRIFKLELEFQLWLFKKMQEETTIWDSRFMKILSWRGPVAVKEKMSRSVLSKQSKASMGSGSGAAQRTKSPARTKTARPVPGRSVWALAAGVGCFLLAGAVLFSGAYLFYFGWKKRARTAR